MELRIQIVAIVASAALFVVVLELVRQRRLLERYALLWLFSAVVLLALAAWKGGLEKLADAVGIYYAPSALFVIACGFILVLLLHFSVAVSRLAEQNKILAQRLALVDEAQRAAEARAAESGEHAGPRPAEQEPTRAAAPSVGDPRSVSEVGR